MHAYRIPCIANVTNECAWWCSSLKLKKKGGKNRSCRGSGHVMVIYVIHCPQAFAQSTSVSHSFGWLGWVAVRVFACVFVTVGVFVVTLALLGESIRLLAFLGPERFQSKPCVNVREIRGGYIFRPLLRFDRPIDETLFGPVSHVVTKRSVPDE